MEFNKIKNFPVLKDIVKGIKRQFTGWEKIPASQIYDKAYVSRRTFKIQLENKYPRDNGQRLEQVLHKSK